MVGTGCLAPRPPRRPTSTTRRQAGAVAQGQSLLTGLQSKSKTEQKNMIEREREQQQSSIAHIEAEEVTLGEEATRRGAREEAARDREHGRR